MEGWKNGRMEDSEQYSVELRTPTCHCEGGEADCGNPGGCLLRNRPQDVKVYTQLNEYHN